MLWSLVLVAVEDGGGICSKRLALGESVLLLLVVLLRLWPILDLLLLLLSLGLLLLLLLKVLEFLVEIEGTTAQKVRVLEGGAGRVLTKLWDGTSKELLGFGGGGCWRGLCDSDSRAICCRLIQDLALGFGLGSHALSERDKRVDTLNVRLMVVKKLGVLRIFYVYVTYNCNLYASR